VVFLPKFGTEYSSLASPQSETAPDSVLQPCGELRLHIMVE